MNLVIINYNERKNLKKMKISGIRQQPAFKNKNVAFGMNFEFSDGFYSMSATKNT